MTPWTVVDQTRLLCPQDSLDKHTRVGGHFLPRGVFLTQELNLGLLHWQVDSLSVRHQSRHRLCVSGCSDAYLCLTFCNSMDCSLLGSSVHGILQARILEQASISYSRGSYLPNASPASAGGLLTTIPPGKPRYLLSIIQMIYWTSVAFIFERTI